MLDKSGGDGLQTIELFRREKFQGQVAPEPKADIRGGIVNPVLQLKILAFGDDEEVVIGIRTVVSPGPGAEQIDLSDFTPLSLEGLEKRVHHRIIHFMGDYTTLSGRVFSEADAAWGYSGHPHAAKGLTTRISRKAAKSFVFWV